MIEAYAECSKNFFESNYPDKSLDTLSLVHKEIFNNIFDHAESSIEGYVISQRYPTKGFIETAICDFGIGISNCLNNYYKSQDLPVLDDRNALKKAMERSVSAKSTPQNRGFGLANLSDYVLEMKGEMWIASNGAVHRLDTSGKKHFWESPVKFNGTVIFVRLNESNLPESENEINEDEFTF